MSFPITSLLVHGRSLALLTGLVALVLSTGVRAQATQSSQLLDQVNAFNGDVVLEMAFDDPNRATDFTTLLESADKPLSACKLATDGTYCLESANGADVVRYWPEPQSRPETSVAVLACNDQTLGFTGGQCSGMTVDLDGAIWLAGSKAGGHSLVKVLKRSILQSGSCSSGGWIALTGNPDLCANEYVAARAPLTDLDSIDGDVAEALGTTFGTGVLAIEGGATVVFFPDVDGASPIPDPGFGDWALTDGETLISASLLQVPLQPGEPAVRSYVLAMTDTGRILAKEALDPAPTGVRTLLDVTPQPAILIDDAAWSAHCLGQQSCSIDGATLVATGGNMGEKTVNGGVGLGVQGRGAGNEIDRGESLQLQLPDVSPNAYTVESIQILFLYDGPEFGDRNEQASITVTDARTPAQTTYTLTATGEATAEWTGPGTITNCGPASSSGTGCFLISNPFPEGAALGTIEFTAGDNLTSDFAIGRISAAVKGVYGVRTSLESGFAYVSDRAAQTVSALAPDGPDLTTLSPAAIDANTPDGVLSTAPFSPDGLTVAPGISLNLANCTENCAFRTTPDGVVAASFNNVTVAEGSSTGIRVFEVQGIIDCRYRLQDCRSLLIGGPAASEAIARQELIAAGWIKCVDSATCTEPATQLLNATPQLPRDVTSQFDSSGVAPDGLPPLYLARTVRGQVGNDYRFNAFFFKTAAGIVFLDRFGGEIDVFELTGRELGCEPVAGRLLDWDVITTVSETYKSVDGLYIDTITNVGCRNPTKVSGVRLSLFPYNLEVAPDTYAPTVRSFRPRVTVNNDAVFARLAQSLWNDLGESRRDLACRQVDAGPAGGSAPLSDADCKLLGGLWLATRIKLDLCVAAAFGRKNAFGDAICSLARQSAVNYQSALPAVAAGPDVANRLGEQGARVETFLHVFDTRFVPSITADGYCREWGRCGP